MVYVLTTGIIVFSLYYVLMFFYLNSRILTYNNSNLKNIKFLTYFMNVDRHILTGLLALDSLTEFAEVFFDGS